MREQRGRLRITKKNDTCTQNQKEIVKICWTYNEESRFAEYDTHSTYWRQAAAE